MYMWFDIQCAKLVKGGIMGLQVHKRWVIDGLLVSGWT